MGKEQVDFGQWQQMAKQILGNEFFADFYGSQAQPQAPDYNIYQNSSEIIVLISLPYVQDLSQIKLNVKEQEIRINGKIDFGFNHLEKVESRIFNGPFEATIPLPKIVNTKKVNAQYQRGILSVQLFPKLRREGKQVHIRDN